MKILVVLASCAAVASAGIIGFGSQGRNNNGGNGNIGYSAPGSLGGGYSSGFSSFGSNGGIGGAIFTGFGGGAGAGLNSGNNGFGNEGLRSVGSSGNGFGTGRSNGNGNTGTQAQQGGQVRRFVSVHVAPEEEAPKEPRIIRAGGPADTHYNIIFVKAPSGASQQQTEVVLPEPPKQKTLVYVLIKRPDENKENVKIRAPEPTKASKPEVYFIRYKGEGDSNGSQGENQVSGAIGGNNSFGSSGFNGNALDSSYGTPSVQSGGGSNGGYQ